MSEAHPAAEAVKLVTGASNATEPTVEALRAAEVTTVVRQPDPLEVYADHLRHMLCTVVKQFGGQINLRPQALEPDAVVVMHTHTSGRATLKLTNARAVKAAIAVQEAARGRGQA